MIVPFARLLEIIFLITSGTPKSFIDRTARIIETTNIIKKLIYILIYNFIYNLNYSIAQSRSTFPNFKIISDTVTSPTFVRQPKKFFIP